MRKYDLEKMLAEIRRDEGGGPEPVVAKQVLTQAQIKAMARARPRRAAGKPPAK
jgi:hypothetical protein